VLLYGACQRGDAEHAATVLADIAELTGAPAAQRWGRLAYAIVGGPADAIGVDGSSVPADRQPARPPGTPRVDILKLTALGLRAETARHVGVPAGESVAAQLRAAVAAGARCPLGWPFDLLALADV
jgi:hypothetical protein